MTFNSTAFLLLFLPLAVTLFVVGSRFGRKSLRLLLFAVLSMGFYAFSGWYNVGLLLLSVVGGHCILSAMVATEDARRKRWLWLAVGFQVGLLVFFKYANFMLANWAMLAGGRFAPLALALPLGISFYVFNQIGYAVALYRRTASRLSFLEYLATVSFFPYLASGPLVSLDTVAGQMHEGAGESRAGNLAVGLSLMVVGLFKKVVLGDAVAVYADAVFDLAATPAPVDFVHAWLGALSYTFQIYFDFSGYTDMAIGVARMFGVILPQNFNSPYKSASIAEFWRRWHITLSKFFRDHLYIPLGGNRKGLWRQNVNLLATMLLCGLWHGAGWTFILWGALHGLFLCGQRLLVGRLPAGGRPLKVLGTFILIVVSWVVFRAGSVAEVAKILAGMAGMAGFYATAGVVKFKSCLQWLVGAALICFAMPNSQQLFHDFQPCLIYKGFNDNLPRCGRLAWRPGLVGFLVIFSLWLASLYHIDRGASFIYAQF